MSVHGVFRHRRRLSTLKTYRMLFIPNSSSHIYDLLLFQYKNIILNIKKKILSCLKSRPFLVNLVLSLFSTEISFDSFLSCYLLCLYHFWQTHKQKYTHIYSIYVVQCIIIYIFFLEKIKGINVITLSFSPNSISPLALLWKYLHSFFSLFCYSNESPSPVPV